jgi:hypothetical protein
VEADVNESDKLPEYWVERMATTFAVPMLPHRSEMDNAKAHLEQCRMIADVMWRQAFHAGMTFHAAITPAVLRVTPEQYEAMLANMGACEEESDPRKAVWLDEACGDQR